MRKKIAFAILVFCVFIASFCAATTLKKGGKIVNNFKYSYIVSGAVLSPQEINTNQKLTPRQIFAKTGLESDADVSSFDYDKIKEPGDLFVPYKMEKIKMKNLNNIIELTKRGVGKTAAKRIIEYAKTNEEYSWDEVLRLPGVGPATFEKVQNIISID
ncbi:MAG0490 family ComEA-like DNA-binding protein [Mycoplasma sp. Ms02]|uniref:MAG0490 family ComEA-like DNA-binding protein n=1 Tax=Mycoplasma sp. Ms02 TaxID=353851 RepID=UPI001C894AB4|nr:hypothetical protein [Mycoplasma sp. Ms02]QZE12604.1 hypothetical protein K4L35_01300 [Mycoplasma sp. Ms02]